MDIDLRRSPRIPFIASAEVTEMETQVRLLARTGDISRHGCYMDMVNPLPFGTSVALHIVNDSGAFDATAGVVYSVPHLGMGLSFQQVDAADQATLERWLAASAAS
jgi:PilZ domain